MTCLKMLVLVFLLLNIQGAKAQVELIFGDSLVNEKAIATYPMPDGSFWVLGFTNAGVYGGADVTLLRIDSLGNTITPTIYYGGPDNDYPNNMIYKSGKLIIAGETHTAINSNVDGFICVVDTTGAMESFDTYGQVGQTEQFFDIKSTQDGGFVVSGFASLPSRIGNDFLIAKFDERDNYDWMQIHDLGTNDVGMVVVEKPQGGYIVVGDQLQSSGNYNIAIIGCDTLGNLLWDTTVASSYNGGCKQVAIQDDQLVIVGEIATATSTAFDIYLVRTDLQGNLIWKGTVPKTDYGDAVFDLVVTSLNEIYVTGYAYNNATQGTDLYVAQLDSMAGVVSERYYGGTSFDMGIDIKVRPDGRFVISGFSNRQTNDQYYVIYDSFNPVTSVKYTFVKEEESSIYPNPTTSWVYVPKDLEFDRLEIVNQLGQVIAVQRTTRQIDLGSFDTGSYWFLFKDKKGNIVSSQLLVKE